MEGIASKIENWNEAFESKGFYYQQNKRGYMQCNFRCPNCWSTYT